MINWLLLIPLLLAAVTLFSLLKIWQSDFSQRLKLFFSIIRVLMGGALVCMVLEPTFHIRYLSKSDTPLPVLVDASASMSHFAADSVVTSLRKSIDSIAALHPETARKTEWYLFGDSLRIWKKGAVSVLDKRSFFPDISSIPSLAEAQEAIIISDGHWSSSELPFNTISSALLRYLPLTIHHQPPSLAIDLPDTVSAVENSLKKIAVHCKGNTSDTTRLSFTLTSKDTVVRIFSSPIPRGAFTHTFSITLPAEKEGYHLYDCSVVSITDSLRSNRKMLYKVLPESFRCSFISSRPSLDERFLRLAVDRSDLFRKSSRKKASDVYFIFDNAKPLPENDKGVFVFLGTPPLKSVTVSGDSLSFTLPAATLVNPFAHLPLSDLPPVRMAIPRNRSFIPVHTYLAANSGKRSFPVIFSDIFKQNRAIFCSLSDFWKWDFLPLAHQTGEADIFSFSESLLKLVEPVLVAQKSDTLIAFTPGTSSNADSVTVLCVTPSISTRDSAELFFHFTDSSGNNILDTAFTLRSSFVPLARYQLPPLSEGSYTQLCSLSVGGKSYVSYTTFTVATDNSEHLINDQNESLLRQFCTSLPPVTDLQASPFFSGSATLGRVNRESSRIISIQRSWWLLGVFLLLFFVEIAIRKIRYYD